MFSKLPQKSFLFPLLIYSVEGQVAEECSRDLKILWKFRSRMFLKVVFVTMWNKMIIVAHISVIF